MTARTGPLVGVRVVEFAGIGAAPFCAMVLGDLGADVIRVERRSTAPSAMGRITDGILSRSRRSVAIDLKSPDGLAIALDLVGGADVLIEGFRPGVMERLGLGPDTCLERHPALVYGRLSGWGQDGPYAQAAGHDINYIAVAGALDPVGRRDQRPVPPLNLIGDFGGGGLLLAMGVLAALIGARASGVGQVVDAAMVEGSAYLMTMMFELLGRGRWAQQRESNPNDGGAAFYDTYETADGRYVAVGAMEPRFFAELLEHLGLAGEDLGEQWDPATWPAAKARLAEVLATRTRDQWCELLAGADACVSPVLSMSEAIYNPHNIARRTFVDVDGVASPAPAPRFSHTPAGPPSPPRAPGADTDAVLREQGCSAARIAELRRAGAIG